MKETHSLNIDASNISYCHRSSNWRFVGFSLSRYSGEQAIPTLASGLLSKVLATNLQIIISRQKVTIIKLCKF
jgi:hypothetical protein